MARPFRGSAGPGEERRARGRRRTEGRQRRPVVEGLGTAAAPVRGQGAGAAEWNEGNPVDMVEGGEEACAGRTQAKAEAAMEGDGEQRRDVAILVTK